MRTEAECLAKAVDLERRAALCEGPVAKADFLHMAECWRQVASQATWQDAQGYQGL